PVMSCPASMMRPAWGLYRPTSRLKRVVLPAPLGPIRPRMSPWATRNDTASTAFRPPKRRLVPSTVSMSGMAASARLPHALPQRHQPARLEQDDGDQDEAVGQLRDTGALAGQPVVEQFFQRDDEQGADQRTGHGADAADDADERHPHGDAGQREHRVRIE